ncbi:MAG: MaoC family dehydratase N-terminal domain-containing protein, partial [Spirochaetia bacterium]|nr:MaoC family dehydratase N-terminal domain-containing protein [Spirochaetia bacterium]
MDLSKDIIGHKLNPLPFTVERGKLREFCLAIGETNPIYTDPEAARSEGFRDTPVPPTFQTVFVFWGYPEIWNDMKSLGIDVERLLHMKEQYHYHHPVYPGDEITPEGSVEDVKTGKMDMVTFHTVYKNQEGQTCIEARMSIVLRP